jgi:hypothetical protein
MRLARDKGLIRNLIAWALLALVLAPLISLHQLGAVEARASVRIVETGGVRIVTFDALLASTRL